MTQTPLGNVDCWYSHLLYSNLLATSIFVETPVKEGKRGKRGCESLKLPTALNYHAAYFYILAVYFKIRFTMLCLSGFELYSHWAPLTADCVCPFKKQS